MIIGVTGHYGKLGTELKSRGCIPLNFDVTSIKSIQENQVLREIDVLINCAAVTDVDACEYKRRNEAFIVNTNGVINLRNNYNGRFIQMSTDYIFNGVKGEYKENSVPDPVNAYGMSKLYAEKFLLDKQCPEDVIVRTTLLYGGINKDFVKSILVNLWKNETFTVTTSLYGNPTYVNHLADAIMFICENKNIPRIIHVGGKEILNRYEFALAIADTWGLDKQKIIPTKEVSGVAYRPRKAGMSLKLAEKCSIPLYKVFDGLEAMKNESINNNTFL